MLSETVNMGESARDETIIVCQQKGELTGRFSQKNFPVIADRQQGLATNPADSRIVKPCQRVAQRDVRSVVRDDDLKILK
jgi:hypothetical protein